MRARMKKLAVVLLASLFFLPASLRTAQLPDGPDTRLILLVAVDQFRYDYLTRFRSEYTDGIKRLLTNGAVFTNANLEHYPTVTAIGHATMLTGATPSVSGIIGNDWFDRETNASVTSVSDGTVKPLGSATGSAASPRRLLVSTVGDQLKLASAAAKGTPEAPRVFGMSLKDRSAILPVGRGANAAFWWDTKTGSFVTSTYYGTDACGLGAVVQRTEAAGRRCRRELDGAVGAVPFAPAAPGRARRSALRSDLRQSLRQRAARRVRRRAADPRTARQCAMRRTCWRSASHRTTRSVIPTAPTRHRSGTSPFERIGRLVAC